MRPQLLLIAVLAVSAQASWFGSESKPEYNKWNSAQLNQWLNERNIKVPDGYSQDDLRELVRSNWDATSAWTQDQYERAQSVFTNVKDSTFDAWDESRLREFLLEQGVVAPAGPRESLVVAAKKHYKDYTYAASSFASAASATASSAVYGDKQDQASKTMSSASKSAHSVASSVSSTASVVAAQASASAMRAFDESKDYAYSTWDDNRLRSYLETKAVKVKQGATRDQLLAYMKDSYVSATEPAWNAWSDSYVRDWLVAYNILPANSPPSTRDKLSALMTTYYYDPLDSVYSSWSDSQLKSWLVKNGVVTDASRPKRQHMMKLVQDNYRTAVNTPWEAWRDSDMRIWLVKNGYLRSDAQIKRDQLVKLMNEKYTEASARSAAYLTWPDARLRAFLRENGMPEEKLPTSRPGLLQETRIRYVQASSRLESLLNSIRDMINGGVVLAEDKVGQVLEILTGTTHDVKKKAKGTTEL